MILLLYTHLQAESGPKYLIQGNTILPRNWADSSFVGKDRQHIVTFPTTICTCSYKRTGIMNKTSLRFRPTGSIN